MAKPNPIKVTAKFDVGKALRTKIKKAKKAALKNAKPVDPKFSPGRRCSPKPGKIIMAAIGLVPGFKNSVVFAGNVVVIGTPTGDHDVSVNNAIQSLQTADPEISRSSQVIQTDLGVFVAATVGVCYVFVPNSVYVPMDIYTEAGRSLRTAQEELTPTYEHNLSRVADSSTPGMRRPVPQYPARKL